MRLKRGFAGVILLVVSLGVSAGSMEFPLIQSIAYSPEEAFMVPEPGQWRGSITIRMSNSFSVNELEGMYNDFGMVSATGAGSYGWSERISLEVCARTFVIYDGVADSFLNQLHDTLGLEDGYRSLYPESEIHYGYRDVFDYRDTVAGISPLVVGAVFRLYQSGQTMVRFRLSGGIPLRAKPGISSDKPFLAMGVEGRRTFGAWFYQGRLTWIHVSGPAWWPGELRSSMWLLESWLGKNRWRLGVRFRRSPFTEGDIAHTGFQVLVEYRLRDNLDIFIEEDRSPYDTTPDISIGVRYRY